MNLRLKRIVDTGQSTIGMIYIDNQFECFTLEDTFRAIKLAGETRIPEGRYNLRLNKSGSMNGKYRDRFGADHKGMIEIENVENFKSVYIHIGNTAKDTRGCILVGKDMGKNHISNSKDAYVDLYAKVVDAIEFGSEVKLTITDCERRKNHGDIT